MQNWFKETKFEWTSCSQCSVQSCGLRNKLFTGCFSPFEVKVQIPVWVNGMYFFMFKNEKSLAIPQIPLSSTIFLI